MGICNKAVNVVNIAAKTINLAKEPLRCYPPPVCPQIPPPPAKSIRICTPEDLRAQCPPDPCIFPDPIVPLTTGQRIFNASIIVAKTVSLLGFIKFTHDLGIWGNTESTRLLLSDIIKQIKLWKPGNEDVEPEYIYGHDYNLGTIWNDGVEKVFDSIRAIISFIPNKIKEHFNKVSNDLENKEHPMPIEEPPKDEIENDKDANIPPNEENEPPKDENEKDKDANTPPEEVKEPPKDEKQTDKDANTPPKEQKEPPKDEKGKDKDANAPPKEDEEQDLDPNAPPKEINETERDTVIKPPKKEGELFLESKAFTKDETEDDEYDSDS